MKIPTLGISIGGCWRGTLEQQLPFKNYDQILNFWRVLFPRASSRLAFSFVPARNRRNVTEDRRQSIADSSSFDHPQDKFTRQDMHVRNNGLSIDSRVTNSRYVVKGSSKHDAIVKARGTRHGFVSRTKQETEGKC